MLSDWFFQNLSITNSLSYIIIIIYPIQLVSEAKRKSAGCIDSMLGSGQRPGTSRRWVGSVPTTGCLSIYHCLLHVFGLNLTLCLCITCLPFNLINIWLSFRKSPMGKFRECYQGLKKTINSQELFYRATKRLTSEIIQDLF